MEHPSYQPYFGYQSYESYPPTYQPDYSNPHPSYTLSYPEQTCPDQPHHQPQPQQSFESTSGKNYNTNSAARETEGVTAFQPDVQNSMKPDAEMIMEMQHTCEEQQSHVDSMIIQVALLAEMIKEVKENRARSEIYGSVEVNEGVKKDEEREPAEAEEKSEALSEEEQRTEEIEVDEEESTATPPEDEASREIIEEACDESRGNEEIIECGEKIDNHSLNLQ